MENEAEVARVSLSSEKKKGKKKEESIRPSIWKYTRYEKFDIGES